MGMGVRGHVLRSLAGHDHASLVSWQAPTLDAELHGEKLAHMVTRCLEKEPRAVRDRPTATSSAHHITNPPNPAPVLELLLAFP